MFRPLDALPRLRKLKAGDYGSGIGRRIACLFPERSALEREAILRRFLRYRLANRIIYRFTMRFPGLASLISTCIPVVGKTHVWEANARDGPIIIATAHFGSLYFMSLIVARALSGRRLYVMHKKTIADARRDETFLIRRGIVSVSSDERGLLSLVRVLRKDPRAAVLLAFDPPVGKRHAVRFLATRQPASMGVGMFADIGQCAVVPLFWHYDGCRPSVFIAEPIYPDPALPAPERRVAVVERLYALLEARVARCPEQWHLDFVHEAFPAAGVTPPTLAVSP